MFSDWLVVLSLACLLAGILGAVGVWWLEYRVDMAEAQRRVEDWTR